jgi:hypothetical protein
MLAIQIRPTDHTSTTMSDIPVSHVAGWKETTFIFAVASQSNVLRESAACAENEKEGQEKKEPGT